MQLSKNIKSYVSDLFNSSARVAQLVECLLRGTGGHGFHPGPQHTEVVKNGPTKLLLAWHSDLQDRARSGQPTVMIM